MIETNTCSDGGARLRAFGDFCSGTAVSLRHLVNDSVYHGLRLTIDLGRVEHIDAEGVSALVGSVRRARAIGGTLRIVNARPRVRAIFELAGVDGLLLGSNTPTDDAA